MRGDDGTDASDYVEELGLVEERVRRCKAGPVGSMIGRSRLWCNCISIERGKSFVGVW